MISRRRLLGTATALGTASVLGAATPARAAQASALDGTAALRVTRPTVEYARNPLGLDTPRPRLSWPVTGGGAAQSAYRIRVATSSALLDRPDVWDSGQVSSGQSVLVAYDGPELAPCTRYYWSVRVWDDTGTASEWSTPSWWETGLAGAGWEAEWIAAPELPDGAPDLASASWIWFPEGDPASSAPAETRWFRARLEIPAGVTRARLVIAADDRHTTCLDGEQVTEGTAWNSPNLVDVTDRLNAGTAVVAVSATNGAVGPAGLIGLLELTTADGVRALTTGAGWKAVDTEPAGDWTAPGFDDSGWADAKVLAPWGQGPWGEVKVPAAQPAVQLRHEFTLPDRPVARARLYATALGVYEPHLNGRRVGSDQLAPGWTDYNERVQYQTYDVTDLVQPGANALGAHLGAGWYAGNLASFGPHHYGERPALLAQLEVTYADGTVERALTGTGWRAAAGPITAADLLMGEDYDARRETDGWTSAGFDDSGWQPAEPADAGGAAIVAQVDGPVRVESVLPAREVTEPEPGAFVFDLGQNMVGAVRLRVTGEAGTTVTLRYAEVLNPDGTLYTANLRSARATDTYTLRGGREEVYEPRFTFHGFRYVEVTGYPGTPAKDAVTGLVMHTSAPFTMDFETNVPMLNQLHRNITWGQRGNFLSIPTDTPARDERLGWTGDINVFAPTATYTMESARFLTKWLYDLRDDQDTDGGIPDVAPWVGPVGKGVAGWGDAGVTVPWALYQAYGDRRVLEQSWYSMVRWLAYLERNSSGLLRPASGYGDWLNVGDETPKDVVATAYFAHSAELVGRVARVLGRDPGPYETLFGRIREAFRAAYVSQGGARIKGDTQTAYVLALSMDLLTEESRKPAADRLVELIRAREWHLSTGFLGTPRLLPVLTATGHTDVAYRLLQQETFPGWGYQIAQGATTMWERWDSIKPDGSFQDAAMNSFNHYAYGCVGEWMYRHVTGIEAAAPGFAKLTVRPRPGGTVTEAHGRLQTLYGPVATFWQQRQGGFDLEVTLPFNTTAEVWVPASSADAVTHGTAATFLRLADGCAVFAVSAGTHRFAT